MSIRRARVDDAERVGLFQTLTWEQTYRGIVPDSFLDARSLRPATDRWAERIGTGSRRVFVAESPEEQVIGVASTSRSSGDSSSLPSLELSTLYVDREAQGTGVASSLLNAALNEEDAHSSCFRSTSGLSASTPSTASSANEIDRSIQGPGSTKNAGCGKRGDRLSERSCARPGGALPPSRMGIGYRTLEERRQSFGVAASPSVRMREQPPSALSFPLHSLSCSVPRWTGFIDGAKS